MAARLEARPEQRVAIPCVLSRLTTHIHNVSIIAFASRHIRHQIPCTGHSHCREDTTVVWCCFRFCLPPGLNTPMTFPKRGATQPSSLCRWTADNNLELLGDASLVRAAADRVERLSRGTQYNATEHGFSFMAHFGWASRTSRHESLEVEASNLVKTQ